MAIESTQTCISFTAEVDLSSWQYKPVKIGSANMTVDKADADNDPTIGILQNKPVAGQPAEVCVAGISKAIAGAALSTPGALVECEVTTGGMIAAASGGFAIGRVVQTAADTEVCSILVSPTYIATA